MERGRRDDVFRQAGHPYMKALLHAVPRFDVKAGERLVPIREIRSQGSALMRRDEPHGESPTEPWDGKAERRAPLLEVRGLSKSFTTRRATILGSRPGGRQVAVDDVSFEVRRGECLGLVGESGCGKTTLSKMLMRAITPDNGAVTYNDRGTVRDVLALSQEELIPFR
ncbi:MAG: ATP-binding cassette domain-containing protein, partial [Alphaproteobacteria bacterium]|nr:ATP-binding cassette domain-containing protein [Alphaproteobacteria bacterium]